MTAPKSGMVIPPAERYVDARDRAYTPATLAAELERLRALIRTRHADG